MKYREHKKEGSNKQRYLGGIVSINDLKEWYFQNKTLESDQIRALVNFDHFRLFELKKQNTEEAFHKRYLQLQVMANLNDYKEFLKEEYNFREN